MPPSLQSDVSLSLYKRAIDQVMHTHTLTFTGANF